MFTQMLPHRIQSFLSSPEHNRSVPLSDASNLAHQFLPGDESLRPSILAALEVLEEFPGIRDLFATFPPHISYAIKASLLVSDRYQYARLRVLERLINKGWYLRDVVDLMRPSPLCLLEHACVFSMIEGMLTDPSKYRRELAFLFAQLPLKRLPPPLQGKLAIASVALPLKVLPANGYWSLCSEAEGRLLKAIRDQAVLLVNDVILLKFCGKLSGVALQTSLLADGTLLLAGCWYSPIDCLEEIRDAFDRGESRLHVEGQWTLIRALDEADNTVLPQAQTYASALPAQLPQQIASFSSRQAYRCSKHEDL